MDRTNGPLQERETKRNRLFEKFGKKQREWKRQHKKEKRQVDGNDEMDDKIASDSSKNSHMSTHYIQLDWNKYEKAPNFVQMFIGWAEYTERKLYSQKKEMDFVFTVIKPFTKGNNAV